MWCEKQYLDPSSRDVRGIFFRRGKATFPYFFPWHEMLFFFFKVEISILVDPKQISVVSKSDKQKKKKGGSSAHFRTFFPSNLHFLPPSFTISLLFFSIFPFFLASFFPASKNFPVKTSGGHCAPAPPACYATTIYHLKMCYTHSFLSTNQKQCLLPSLTGSLCNSKN